MREMEQLLAALDWSLTDGRPEGEFDSVNWVHRKGQYADVVQQEQINANSSANRRLIVLIGQRENEITAPPVLAYTIVDGRNANPILRMVHDS